VAAAGLDAAGAELAGAELAGGLLVELELEQAATPATRQPATAIARYREPVPVHCRISVKRTIAPFRLSAVTPCLASPSPCNRRDTELIDR
jgi:hypothetical protein